VSWIVDFVSIGHDSEIFDPEVNTDIATGLWEFFRGEFDSQRAIVVAARRAANRCETDVAIDFPMDIDLDPFLEFRNK
jgi:hypothetical protein